MGSSSSSQQGSGGGACADNPNTDTGKVSAPLFLAEELDEASNRQRETKADLPRARRGDSNIDAIQQYKIGKTLGQGAYGKVKLARNEQTGHCVAVKVIDRSKLALRPAGSKQIAQEINAMKILRHPHVVRLHEVINTPAKIFMVMEYAAGGDMLTYLNTYEQLVPEVRVQELFRGMIAGLHFCHTLGVYHRDLKLENLLLHAGQVKIGDFGMARITKSAGFCETLCGSPDYAAPEILCEASTYDGQLSDVWSAGVILFALLCRYLPFQAERGDIPSLFVAIKAGTVSIPPHVSQQPAAVVRAMLTVSTSKRPTIAQIRQHPWVTPRPPIKASASLDFPLRADYEDTHEPATTPTSTPLGEHSRILAKEAPASEPLRRLPLSRSQPCVPEFVALSA
uniref:Protein kinase domain-containing protein n=1 Tax=Calcidiscus leptoporus TaxID=127549 RepID=A0A7S0IUL1_9EUKA|mmetsp:Transcript_2263/g.5122  ORF Transcript_2263/g.5122 Transcript_2263/m.5122 type:complete len:396 (+) Transcript_2263:68-1255(+)